MSDEIARQEGRKVAGCCPQCVKRCMYVNGALDLDNNGSLSKPRADLAGAGKNSPQVELMKYCRYRALKDCWK